MSNLAQFTLAGIEESLYPERSAEFARKEGSRDRQKRKRKLGIGMLNSRPLQDQGKKPKTKNGMGLVNSGGKGGLISLAKKTPTTTKTGPAGSFTPPFSSVSATPLVGTLQAAKNAASQGMTGLAAAVKSNKDAAVSAITSAAQGAIRAVSPKNTSDSVRRNR